ncbi:MAG: PQQ-binding-like beta-propeller repeat protein [Verrucomicrobiota bacterium]
MKILSYPHQACTKVLLTTALGALLTGAAHAQVYVSNDFGSQVSEYSDSGQLISADFISTDAATGLALANGTLYVTQGDELAAFNATTGAVDSSFTTVSGLSTPLGVAVNSMAISGGDVYVAEGNGTIGEFNATTGATVNSSLISGLNEAAAISISGGDLYVASFPDSGSTVGTVGVYNATTGAAITKSLVSGLNTPQGLVLANGDLFTLNDGSGTVSEFNATTGTAIHTSLISGLNEAQGMALTSNDDLLITTSTGVREYDLSGDLVNGNFITGLDIAVGIAVTPEAVPEPSAWALGLLAAVALVAVRSVRRA